MARSAAAEDIATNLPWPASIIGGTHASARYLTPDRFTRIISPNASSGTAQARSPLITPAAVTTAEGARPASTSRSVSRTEAAPTSATGSSTAPPADVATARAGATAGDKFLDRPAPGSDACAGARGEAGRCGHRVVRRRLR